MAEKRNDVERRLASEWMAERYGQQEYFLNYPLGPLPPGMTDMRSAIPWLRKVDGLAIVTGTVHLIEFKIWSPWDGFDKLPVYKLAIPETPWLGDARRYPVVMLLVTPRSNPYLEATAILAGIQVVKVKGGWIDQVVEHIEWLWSKEGRDAMAERKKMRSWLGLE